MDFESRALQMAAYKKIACKRINQLSREEILRVIEEASD
jgi:hypothetical protein